METINNKNEVIENEVYQCQDCLTIYDEKLGDSAQAIAPNTSLIELPKAYNFGVCEAPKSNFIKT